jgi:hypothetical protein
MLRGKIKNNEITIGNEICKHIQIYAIGFEKRMGTYKKIKIYLY